MNINSKFQRACVLTLAMATLFGASITSAAPPQLRAKPFPLNAVRLLDGPFKAGQDAAVDYLLSFEPDRFLANFRKEAGLEPKAPHYGGWESQGVSGHSGGHYLSACALAYAATGDRRFLDRVNYMVDELAACQQANGNGYVAAIPNGKRIYAEVAAGNIRSAGFDLNGCWVPNYTLHKLFAGLHDAYHMCGNTKALRVSKGLADWLEKTLANLNDNQIQRMLAAEHGGMLESMANLYGDTDDERYLALSRCFHHKAILDPLARGEDILPGKHANTQVPKLIGVARRYELTGAQTDRRAAEFFWDRVVNHHSYVTGGHCDHEHFGEPDKLNDRLSEYTTETCNVYNMLKLTRHLFGWVPEARVADFYERALLNHIRATQHPDGRVIYNLSLKPGSQKQYLTKDSFTCCGGTGFENHVRYGDAIYFHGDTDLWINLFIASEVTWKQRQLVVRQDTTWPIGDCTQLTITCAAPQELTFHIRHPRWATNGIRIAVNGKRQAIESHPSSFINLHRTWTNGDKVTVTFPMSLYTESMPDNDKRIALFHGPTLLAADLGPADDPKSTQRDYVPVLITDGKPVDQWVAPVNLETQTFRTKNVGKPRDVTLVPFHSLHDRHHTVYFDIFTRGEWKEREAETRAQVERERLLTARTIDILRIGEMQPERDHHLKGERTGAGEHLGRKWRHAVDGGWFAFDMKVAADSKNELRCTYWGSDVGQRTFDILIDGTKIAQQELANDNPGQFFDVSYTIPQHLTQGKASVTVRFQALPDNLAGGLFGCRLLRAANAK